MSSTHDEFDAGRTERAQRIRFGGYVFSARTVDNGHKVEICQGIDYHCSCQDFAYGNQIDPCKHLIRFAQNLGYELVMWEQTKNRMKERFR